MRWRQCRHTGEFIPIDQAAKNRSGSAAVHGDIRAFVSPVDGSVISDRKGLREHNKRNNVVNADEFSQDFYDRKATERARLYNGEHTPRESQSRKEEIHEIINHLERKG